LLALAEQRGREQKAASASLIVASENAGAVRLYSRSGYKEVAHARVVEYPGCAHGGDWVLMVKPI
jgi:ribosomal protein S18 acetylase RimI-like enzyme